MSAVQNAFQMVRPKGAEQSAAVPAAPRIGRPPALLPGSVLRVYGSISFESRAQAQASADKNQVLMKGGAL